MPCPARNKTCDKCGRIGHYRLMCKTKTQVQAKLNSKYSGRKGKGSIHFTSADKIEDSSEDEYAFTVGNKWSDKIDVVVGGVKISMMWILELALILLIRKCGNF